MTSNAEITVGLILGGISGERPVSLESGKAVYDALLSEGFAVKLIDPALGLAQYENPEDYWTKAARDFSPAEIYAAFSPKIFNDVDVVFIALHGSYGEDGVTQTLLDLLGVPYVGSDSFASAIGINKYFTKIIGEKYGVQFPRGFLVKKSESDAYELMKKAREYFNGKFVVKPNRQGSSLGLTVCETAEMLPDALQKGFAVDDELIIEEFIEGKELTVSILLDEALPLIEIVPQSGLYDFEAKYEAETTRYIVPAPVGEGSAYAMQRDALKLFSALGCRHYARVDFRMRGNGEFYCLEINTLPGMTSHSLLPKAAAASGTNFNKLIKKLIYAAIEK